MSVKLRVWGEFACFTRPEMKVERVSYDVMTPSAARGILEAILWKPAIRWEITRIHVLNEIRFQSIRRNEVATKIPARNVTTAMSQGGPLHSLVEEDRQQRAALVLRNVDYVIEARFEMTDKAGPDDNPGKFSEMFRRRASSGQCRHQPYLGCREFTGNFELAEDPPPAIDKNGDLGWMLYDIDFADDMRPLFFRPEMRNGVIDVPPFREVKG
jgi:CRISPR-associated protein Cas5d